MMIQVKNLCFYYGKNAVLKNIDIEAAGGEVVSLVGPNGAGKSTLLKCVNRILKPSGGSVWVGGEDIRCLRVRKLARIFGYVPQASHPTFPATVFETVLLGRRPYLDWRVSVENRDVVYEMLALLNLGHLAMRSFNELSGGEQQRVLIARALVQQPKVLLLDEPTSSLDLKHQLDVLSHLVAIVKSRGVAVIMAIHDLNLASQYSDRIVFLKQGKIYCSGTPGDTLIPANIRAVYEVEVNVNPDFGRPHIVPIGIAAN